jgi:hypothetical protein
MLLRRVGSALSLDFHPRGNGDAPRHRQFEFLYLQRRKTKKPRKWIDLYLSGTSPPTYFAANDVNFSLLRASYVTAKSINGGEIYKKKNPAHAAGLSLLVILKSELIMGVKCGEHKSNI